ncbi:pyrroline-5-carboxylate reductase [Microbaculum marinisediminis]|uniref:Pyrroline-5-carboxylate reductase n=1 Tax=Microbaculum marinisediminis TaxID=2931392 RepID=A0AAW5QVJ1_9HYPH|nr:pyrroline-5-carboxylate reductase [Microbaculum sp. A6E488]MCT8971955.1 pyrroline-5-carboxylate reductase [Microbaculum sp. A6E488]
MSLETFGPVLLVGAGKMGGAMLEGWLERGLPPANLTVLDPVPSAELSALAAGKGFHLNPVSSTTPPQIAVIAVKPQVMDDVLAGVAARIPGACAVVSVAAGKTIANLARHFPSGQPIIRTIPNTPAAIGRGITVCVANGDVDAGQRAAATSLLEACGEVAWIDDEALMDAVTAVSGSGPAYVFLLAECLAEAGVKAGLSADLAMQLARVTVSGAGELLHRSDLDPATLRKNVTSPGGTTEAALRVLMGEAGLGELMSDAVAAATKRGKELAG